MNVQKIMFSVYGRENRFSFLFQRRKKKDGETKKKERPKVNE